MMVYPLDSLSEKQKQAASILCDPASALLSDKTLARQLGVTDRTLRNWRKQPLFQQMMEELRQDPAYKRPMLEQYRQQIDEKLIALCLEGNVKAISLYYQITGVLFDAKHANPTEINGIKIVFESRYDSPDRPPLDVKVVPMEA